MSNHWKARVGSAAFALAAALIVVSPSYGFWFLFGTPHHANDTGHDGCCCEPDYGYVYHHKNTHDEPYFKEGAASEHVAVHHARPVVKRCEAVEEECAPDPAQEQGQCEVEVEKVVVRRHGCSHEGAHDGCHDSCQSRCHHAHGRCGK